jgi:hypothetical protein
MDELHTLYARMLAYGQHADPVIQDIAQKLFFKGHQASKAFAHARDGLSRQGHRYTDEEKLDLICHVTEFLLEGKYPNFEYISEHMLRTPDALQQQTQKLLVEAKWTWATLMETYDIRREDAELLIAPQHKIFV